MRSTRVMLMAGLVVSLLTAGIVPASAQSADDDLVDVIVTLDSRFDVTSAYAATSQVGAVGGEVTQVYSAVLSGYAARVPASALDDLAANPTVASVELDREVTIAAQTAPPGIERVFAASNPDIDIDAADDWRVDVDIAVLDSGVDGDHPDLNVVSHVNCMFTSPACRVQDTQDDNSHGTHVAGTAAALDNDIGVVGVAPGARIWNVKVLGASGSGSISGVIAGIDWVIARADEIEVINMSLSAVGFSSAFEAAVANAVDAGVVVVVAAGNDDENASGYSPAAFDDAITVSSMADFDGLPGGLASNQCGDVDDTGSYFSNYGTVIDVAAPGSCVRSTLPGGGYGSKSGTSMATPHVAGAAALLASGGNDPANRADVEAIRATLLGAGNLNWTDDSGDGVKEPLLDVATFQPVLIAGSDPELPPGFLRVTTSPAVPSQILVDGVPRDTWGLTWVKMPPGTYEISFTDVSGYTTPEPETVEIVSGTTTTVTGEFVENGWLRVDTVPATPGTIIVDGVPRDDWGAWTDYPVGTYEVCYGPVQGFDPPPCETVEVTAGELTEVTATYTENAEAAGGVAEGFLRVTTSPAVPGLILVDGVPRDRWGLDWMKLPAGTYEVSFGDVSGFGTPVTRQVTVTAGQTTATVGEYATHGWLRVTTQPGVAGTVAVDGEPRNDWGLWTDLEPGSYEVCFGDVDGFTTPGCVTEDVVAGQLTEVIGAYTPAG